MKQLICECLNGMRIRQSLPQPYIHQAGTWVSWKGQRLGAEVQGLWSNPRVRAAADCGKTGQGDVREETWWEMPGGLPGKPGSHGNKAILLSHT